MYQNNMTIMAHGQIKYKPFGAFMVNGATTY